MAQFHRNIGGEFLVNTTTVGAQYRSKLTYLASGRFIVTWQDESGTAPDVDGASIRGQLFEADGTAVGTEFVINTSILFDQIQPSVTALAGGGFVVAWNDQNPLADGNGSAIKVQLFDDDAAKSGLEIVADSTLVGNQYEPMVAGLAGGGFVVTWSDDSGSPDDPSSTAVRARIFSAAGLPAGADFLVNQSTNLAQRHPVVAVLDDGNIVIAWQDGSGVGGDSSSTGIKARIFTPTGIAVGNEFLVNSTLSSTQQFPSIAALAGAGFVIGWEDFSQAGGDTSGSAVRARVFGADGTAVAADFVVNSATTGTQTTIVLAGLSNGGFVASWQDQSGSGGDSIPGSIKAQIFDGVGLRLGDEYLVNTVTHNTQQLPSIAADAAGGFTISWSDASGLGADGDFPAVKAQIFVFDAPALTQDDSAATDEATPVPIDVTANDTDPDGPPPAVAEIDGTPVTAGSSVTLASGAIVTLEIDGTLTYDPNDAYNWLTDNSSGAVNLSDTDQFAYALGDGTTASVTVTINGLVSSDDELHGDGGDNAITGTGGPDRFFLHQGGEDKATGKGGNDGFYMGDALSSGDVIDGGAGGNDQVGLHGDYPAYTFGADNLVAIEVLTLLSGTDTRFGGSGLDSYDYGLTTIDENVAAGAILTISSTNLRVGEDVTFDGSEELDGSFNFFAGRGNDTLTGGAMSDGFFFGTGARFTADDRIDGGGGIDQLALRGDYYNDYVVFDSDTIRNIEVIVLLSVSDTRFASSGSNFSYDLTTHDDNVGAGETLTVTAVGLLPTEELLFDGSAEQDGHFQLIGGGCNDVLIGGAMADTLFGNIGDDLLVGGGGNDVFLYRSLTESNGDTALDLIADFTAGDRIHLGAIDANANAAGNQAFVFIVEAGFSSVAGELRVEDLGGGDWVVEGDVDGDGSADLVIFVTTTGPDPLVAADFLL